jgi:ankyrin repeat protein
MIVNRAAIDARDQMKGRAALQWAAEQGNDRLVLLLLEKGADIESPAKDGRTALHIASWEGHKKVVIVLLEKGAKISMVDIRGRTPLHLSARGGNFDLIKLLLGHDASPAALATRDLGGILEGGKRCIGRLSVGNVDVANILLSKNAVITAQDINERTPLHVTVMAGHETMVELLLAHKAVVAAHDKDGATPLHMAAMGVVSGLQSYY